MLQNYFKIAIRNLWHYKAYSWISLLGFSLGMVSVILLFFYIKGELSYDKFHKNEEKIHRVIRTATLNGELYKIGITSGNFAPALQTDFEKSIQASTRVMPNEALVQYKGKNFVEKKFFLADPNFFEFFSFPLLRGDAQQVLSEVNSIVISEAMAQKYFGKQNPIGEILEIDNEDSFVVTGIIKNTNQKSHLDFDFVASIQYLERYDWFKDWWNNNLHTYIQVKQPEQIAQLNAQFPVFMDKYFGEDFKISGNKIGLATQPLTEIYFENDTRYDNILHGDKTTISILSAVAFAIFFIVCFNYINLVTAVSFKRAKEVGIRKVMGSNQRQLRIQFLMEAITITFISGVIAISLSEILLPLFNQYFGLDVTIDLLNWQNIAYLMALIVILGAFAGLYPAFLLSSFRPLKALKGLKQNIGKGIVLRKSLVITQFSISVFMIIATLVIGSQLLYLKNKDLGFNQETIALIDLNNQLRENFETFKNTLLQHSGIQHISVMSGQPGGFHDTRSVDFVEDNIDLRMRSAFVDYDYAETMGLQILEGRNFSRDFKTDPGRAVMLNETALKLLGMSPKEAIGKELQIAFLDSTNRKVVGIVQDYHFASLKDKIEPLIIVLDNWSYTMAVKINPTQFADGLAFMRTEWQKFYPDYPLNYTFLDDTFYQHYQTEQTQSKVFTVFAGISIFLSCLGIFGLASYTAEQRKKEMGIRRVLGASVQEVLRLLSSEFIILIMVASVVASPLAYWFMNSWLQDFAYRTWINPVFFAIAGLGALLIAFGSIAFQTWNTAHVNPADILREE